MEKLAFRSPSRWAPRRAPDPLLDVATSASRGDQTAIRALLIEVGGPMLRAVRKVLGATHPEVEDVTQEAMLGLLDALRGFRGECSIVHFASQIALRRALHFRRHFMAREKVGQLTSEPFEHKERASAKTPHDQMVAEERRRIVLGLLTDLSPDVAEALALHFMLDFTAAEIGEIFSVPENTIWSRLKKGKKVLKQALENDPRLRALLQGEPAS